MQDLLCAADMLISDYSSCIWDYSFTYKPCLLFVPDLKKYKSDRDFLIPIETWGFPLAETNDELVDIISDLDQNEFNDSMCYHHKLLGSYEKGIATEQICSIINNIYNISFN